MQLATELVWNEHILESVDEEKYPVWVAVESEMHFEKLQQKKRVNKRKKCIKWKKIKS